MIRRIVRLSLLASAFAIGGIIGCNLIGTDGSGTSATEEREVGEIAEVTLAGIGDLVVVPGETTRLVVTADDNILPLLEAKVSDGKLTLGVKSGHSVNPKTPIVFTLFVNNLEKLTVSGSGNVAGEGLSGETLEVRVSGAGDVSMKGLNYREVGATVSGAGDITLGGTAEKFTARISGAGDIKAKELKATSGDVTVSGAGDANVWTIGELKARVSGAGDVRYKGSPKVDQKVSGAGSIRASD